LFKGKKTYDIVQLSTFASQNGDRPLLLAPNGLGQPLFTGALGLRRRSQARKSPLPPVTASAAAAAAAARICGQIGSE